MAPDPSIASTRPAWAALGALTALAFPPAARAQEPSAKDDAGSAEPVITIDTVPAPSAPAGSEASVPAAGPVESCPAPRFVTLSFTDEVSVEFAGEVRTDLAGEIAPRGLGLCEPASTSREAAAAVQVRIVETGVGIELDDRLTHKRVQRDLPLTAIPANGRALATAIAIDELLRASWAELTLQRPREAPPEPPEHAVAPRAPSPTPTPRKRVAPRRRSRMRPSLGPQLGYTRIGTEHDALALQLRASLRPSYAWIALSAGPQLALPRHTERGDIDALGATGTLTLGACTHPGARVYACGGARGGIDWLRFRGRGGEGRKVDATLAHVAGAALVAGRLSAGLSLFGEVALGALVRGARITDGTRTLGEIGGMLLSLQLGLELEL